MKYKLVVVLITLLLASGIHVWAKSDDGTGYDRDNSALTGPRLTPSNSGTLLIEQDILINDSIPYVLGFDIYKDNIWQERVYNIQSDEIYNYLLVEYGVGVYDVYVIKNKDSEFYTNIVIN
ncbi:MAG: hypothetical protein UHZ01_06340 [Prevotella sp.]|nr:hypothetical protein [Prevotella sp.]